MMKSGNYWRLESPGHPKAPRHRPALLVGKKDDGVRLCITYRWLNTVAKPYPFPLPRIDELINKLGLAIHISTLDPERGYYQIIVHKDSVCTTGFVSQNEKWEYVRMPFGLKKCSIPFSTPNEQPVS